MLPYTYGYVRDAAKCNIDRQYRKREKKLNIAAFGEDAEGELYILAFDGRIHRFARQSDAGR